jgi:RNA polymerase sigma-70 factor (sigma-E family)
VRFEEFLDAELDGLGRYARVLTGDRQQAHDTLAEALIKVQVHWRRISQMDRPLAYVRRIVTNQFLEERRSWTARMFRSMSPEALPESASAPGGTGRIDDRSQLHTLLESLPKQQRAAIVLRHYLDMTDAEIAEALSCSAGAVRAYISRGFTTLRLTERDPLPGSGPARRHGRTATGRPTISSPVEGS